MRALPSSDVVCRWPAAPRRHPAGSEPPRAALSRPHGRCAAPRRVLDAADLPRFALLAPLTSAPKRGDDVRGVMRSRHLRRVVSCREHVVHGLPRGVTARGPSSLPGPSAPGLASFYGTRPVRISSRWRHPSSGSVELGRLRGSFEDELVTTAVRSTDFCNPQDYFVFKTSARCLGTLRMLLLPRASGGLGITTDDPLRRAGPRPTAFSSADPCSRAYLWCHVVFRLAHGLRPCAQRRVASNRRRPSELGQRISVPRDRSGAASTRGTFRSLPSSARRSSPDVVSPGCPFETDDAR